MVSHLSGYSSVNFGRFTWSCFGIFFFSKSFPKWYKNKQHVLLTILCNSSHGGIPVGTGSHPSWSSLLHLGFFLVHSYERVGLYQFSTVNHCRLVRAQKYHYAKFTTQIAIVPLALLLIFSVKPNQKPWALSATASAAAGGSPTPVQAQRA